MSRRVLITRSEPGASETAGRLTALGYHPIVEPLFGIDPIAAVLPPFDALAFTSANGVRAFASANARRDVPVFCVGARTAEAVRDAGFQNVVSADGDAAALARLIEARLPVGAKLLHSGNEESRGDLSGRLRTAGLDASFIATFRARAVNQPGPALAVHLAGRPVFDSVLIHSPRGAEILADFARRASGRAPLQVAAISPAAASPLKSLASRIEIAGTPDEPALLNALAKLADLG